MCKNKGHSGYVISVIANHNISKLLYTVGLRMMKGEF